MNKFYDLVDELFERKVPVMSALYFAGERLQELQQQSHGTLFLPVDLWVATQEINVLLRRRPEFQRRVAGWAKDNMDKYDAND